MFTTYLFTGLMIISAAIAVILAAHDKHWLSGCFSAFTFGLAASIVIPIWNEPYTTGYVMVGMFFLYYGIMELKESLKPQVSTYKEKKDVPAGMLFTKNPDGTYTTIDEQSIRSVLSKGEAVYENTGICGATRYFCSDVSINRKTANSICNMFRSPSYTHGYDPSTPLGEIARCAYANYHSRGQKYPEWHDVEKELPQTKDLTQHQEIIVQDTDGFYHICDPTNELKNKNGTVRWFNGDVFVTPRYWLPIPVVDTSMNVVRQPSIEFDPTTRNRILWR